MFPSFSQFDSILARDLSETNLESDAAIVNLPISARPFPLACRSSRRCRATVGKQVEDTSRPTRRWRCRAKDGSDAVRIKLVVVLRRDHAAGDDQDQCKRRTSFYQSAPPVRLMVDTRESFLSA